MALQINSRAPYESRSLKREVRNHSPWLSQAAWQATDVIRNPALPRRRLGKVALSQSFCILFYELGGRGHSHHVVVFRLSPDGANLVWHAVLDQAITDPAALLMAIDEGQVEDDPRYGFSQTV